MVIQGLPLQVNWHSSADSE